MPLLPGRYTHWPTMAISPRKSQKANELIEKGKLFEADALGVKVYVNGRWEKPSDVPEAFGYKKVVRKK